IDPAWPRLVRPVPYRMHRIDEQVQNDLAQLARMALNDRQTRAQVAHHLGNEFPLVPGDFDRAAHDLVKADLGSAPNTWMGELFHGLDNVGDARYALQRLAEGRGDLRQRKIKVGLVLCFNYHVSVSRTC